MPDWTHAQLLLFLLLFVPGFISIKVYDLLIPAERRDFQSTLSEAIGYSALNFAVLLPLIVAVAYGYGIFDGLWPRVAVAYVVLLIAPVAWPWLFVRVIQRLPSVFVNPVLKPWDVVFRQRGESWIILHMNDGRRIGGRFARGSEASSYPAEEQLYLKEVWRLDPDGGFVERVDRTGGIIVSGRSIEAVEFFD